MSDDRPKEPYFPRHASFPNGMWSGVERRAVKLGDPITAESVGRLEVELCRAMATRDENWRQLFDATNERGSLRAELSRLREENENFKRIGQNFEKQSRDHFYQSCANLDRAVSAEAKVMKLREALGKIATGKHADDKSHPLGEWFVLAGRCVAIAQDAIRDTEDKP